MSLGKEAWERAVQFHGHTCPGLAIGFRVAGIALRELDAIRSVDEELVAVVENDACGVDAIQALTGCSMGKGNLLFRDYGKHVYTFACRDSGKAVRISTYNSIWNNNPEYLDLRQKYFGGQANAEEKAVFQQQQQDRMERILNLEEKDFCKIDLLDDYQLPTKARIFQSVLCASCGEPVMEARARVKDGAVVCIPCADNYTRGW